MIWWLACAVDEPAPPDVLVISVDTLRADRSLPSIEALGGRVFRQATTPLPRTTPALGSLLTGLAPHRHGSREVGEPVEHGDTLAELMGGWTRVGLSATKVAGPKQGLDRGFDTFEVHHDVDAAELTARALELLPEAPWLLWVHYADPHFPYEGGFEACEALYAAEPRAELFVDRGGRSSAALASCEDAYDAEVAQVDRAVGALLAALPDRPRFVVFTSDHGEHFGEAGLYYEHGPSTDDAALRVPLVVAGPGLPTGDDLNVAGLEDVVPTLGAALGLVVPPGLDGRDLFGPARRSVAVAESGSALHVQLHGFLWSGRQRKDWCWNGAEGRWCGGAWYDVAADPRRGRPLDRPAPESLPPFSPERAHELVARTSASRLTWRPGWAGYEPSGDQALGPALARFAAELGDAAPERDDETVEALRALGYVD